MGQDIPVAASALGGVYNYKDGRTAPDTINVLLEYPAEFTATFEATLAPGITGAGVELAGTKGRLLIDRAHYEFHSAEKGAPPVVVQASGNLDQQHMQNFLDCMRSRQTPNGDVLAGIARPRHPTWGIFLTCRSGASISTRCGKRSCHFRRAILEVSSQSRQ